MDQSLLLGSDLGTTGLKTVLMDRAGKVLASAYREYPSRRPRPGWVEQDPEEWWAAFCWTCQQVLAHSKRRAEDIVGISVSSQAPTVLPMSEEGVPLGPAFIWADKRAEAQCRWLEENVGLETIRGINGGNSIDPYYAAPKMLWLKTQKPEIFNRTHCFLQVNGYINFQLTGVYSIDLSHMPLLLLFDSARGDWSPELLDAMGLPREKMPPLFPCSGIIGHVTPTAAEVTGLEPGIPVVAGGVDTATEALGAGTAQAGQGFISAGTGANIGVCVDRPIPAEGLVIFPHVVPRLWMLDAVMTATGGSFKWFRDQLGDVEIEMAQRLGLDPYDVLTLEAEKEAPGAGGVIFLPYMQGEQCPIWDVKARGVFFGLSLSTTKAQLIRAVMEGCVYGLKHNIKVIESVSEPVAELRIVGGAAKSRLWNQITADILGVPVVVPEVFNSAPVGNAILAGMGVGLYPDLEETLPQIVSERARFYPRPEVHEIYNRFYEIYEGLYPALKDSFHRLAAVTT